jgi:serine/threonine protein kinase
MLIWNIHHDIKPENLVIDDDGYVRITDFGIARVWRPENEQDTSGIPGYMVPEIMYMLNHSKFVDYFTVGVMAFKCMFGRRPYVGKSRKEIRDHILSKKTL